MTGAHGPVPRYGLARLFILRMTGFPVDLLERLRSDALAVEVERVIEAERVLEQTAAALIERLRPFGPDEDYSRRTPDSN